jgi:hypothetical protein
VLNTILKEIKYKLRELALIEVQDLKEDMLLNTQELEDLDRELMLARGLNPQQYSQLCNELIRAPQIENADLKILQVQLIRKYRKMSGDLIEQTKQKFQEASKKHYKLNKKMKSKKAKLKDEDKEQLANSQWSMISVMQNYLLIYGLLDFTGQIIFQMPIIPFTKAYRQIGLRKVMQFNNDAGLTAADSIKFDNYIRNYGT